MKYTENDIKEGMKLRCTKANPRWWTVGKLYNVSLNDDGILQITDDNGHGANIHYMLDCLNGNHNPVSFEIVEEEKEMTNYVEVTKVMEFTPDEEVIEIGKKYKVLYPTLSGVYIYASKAQPKYFIYNNQFKYSFESNKEEKEMKKYAKITKYAGLIDTDKENGLEIGKEYEIVKFSSVSEDCWVYLNDKRPEYFISETQYELVEKEEAPTLKANVKVDTLEVIEAKIEQLANEQTNLYNKRMRIKEQEESLREKRIKLKEAKKSLEFLKKQNYL